jgi:hypothetical protein
MRRGNVHAAISHMVNGHLLGSFGAPADTASSYQNCSRIQRQSLVMVGTGRVAAIPPGDPAHGVARNLALLTPQFSCCFVPQSDFGRSGRRPWAQSLRISPKAGLWRGSQRALPRED